jgi:hypothetical protein
MPRRLGGALGLDLVAHDADVFGRRADELDVVFGEDFRERRSPKESRSRDAPLQRR